MCEEQDKPQRKICGVLTQQAHDQLLKICKIADGEAHSVLLDAVVEMRHYLEIAFLYNDFPALGQHRSNLSAISGHAIELIKLLSSEPLFSELLADALIDREGGYYASLRKAGELQQPFVSMLHSIAENAARLSDDDEALKHLRIGKDDSKKSNERRLIWDPFLNYWLSAGNRVGYSENGPIISALRIIHDAFGIPAPEPDAVRQAIRDFQKGGVLRVVK